MVRDGLMLQGFLLSFYLLGTGDGLTHFAVNHYGLTYMDQAYHLGSSFDAAAREDVLARKLH